jgi:hypothetical protein
MEKTKPAKGGCMTRRFKKLFTRILWPMLLLGLYPTASVASIYDVYIEELWSDPSPPVGMQFPTFIADIFNYDTANRYTIYVDFWLQVDGSWYEMGNTAYTYIEANSWQQRWLPLQASLPGGVSYTVEADLYARDSSTDPWVYIHTASGYYYWSGTPYIDLSGLTCTINAQGQTDFNFIVDNTGNAYSGIFDIDMFVDGVYVTTPVQFTEFDPRADAYPIVISVPANSFEAGSHTVSFVSPHDSVQGTYQWTSDIELSDIGDICLEPDGTYTGSFWMWNYGTGYSLPFNVHVWVDGEDWGPLYPEGVWLPADYGFEVTVGFPADVFEAGRHYIEYRATVSDGTENNNFVGADFAFTSDIELSGIGDITMEPDGTYTGSFWMWNHGTGYSLPFNVHVWVDGVDWGPLYPEGVWLPADYGFEVTVGFPADVFEAGRHYIEYRATVSDGTENNNFVGADFAFTSDIELSGIGDITMEPDGTYTGSFWMWNHGTGYSLPFNVHVWVDGVDWGPLYLEDVRLLADDGFEVTVEFPDGVFEAGRHYIEYRATVSDGTENNNFVGADFTFISDIELSGIGDICLEPDGTYTGTFWMWNHGTGYSLPFNVHVWVDGVDWGPLYLEDVRLLADDGFEVTVEFPDGVFEAGRHYIEYRATVSDGTENNNFVGADFTFISDIELSGIGDICLEPDGTYTGTFWMWNHGTGYSLPFNVHVWVDGVDWGPLYLEDVRLLADDGFEVTVEFPDGVFEAGRHYIEYRATVSDGTENNNFVGADFMFTSDVLIHDGRMTLEADGSYTASFSVFNDGTGRSKPFNIAIFADGDMVVDRLFHDSDVWMYAFDDVSLELRGLFPPGYFSPGDHMAVFVVDANDDHTGNNPHYVPFTVTYAVLPPNGFAVDAGDAPILSFMWSPPASVPGGVALTGYRLYYGSADYSWQGTYDIDPARTTFAWQFGAPGTYAFRMTALYETFYGDSIESGFSSAAFAAVPAASDPPATPAGLAVHNPGTGSRLDLTWNAVSGTLDHYHILRQTGRSPDLGAGDYDRSPLIPPTATGWSDTGLVEGHTYYYVIQAASAADAGGPHGPNHSAPSAPVSGTPSDNLAPQAPGNFSGFSQDGRVELWWSKPALNADGTPFTDFGRFSLERRHYPYEAWRPIAAPVQAGFVDADPSLAGNHTYYYRVQAVDTHGNGGVYAETSVRVVPADMPPAPPVGLAVRDTEGRDTGLTLSWAASAETDISHYRVYRRTDGQGVFALLADGLRGTSYEDRDIQFGVQYTYYATAVDAAAQESAPGNHASNTPRLLRIIAPLTTAPVTLKTYEDGVADIVWEAAPEYRRKYPGAVVRLEIASSSGETVYTDDESVPLGSDRGVRTFSWNGKRDSGDGFVDSGKYTCTLRLLQSASGSAAAEVSEPASIEIDAPRIDLDVDTDRDGTVEDDEDEAGESIWSSSRGAIFSVNCDRDGYRLGRDGLPCPDAIRFGDDGYAVDEDYVIERGNGDADEQDITPLVIRKIASSVPSGYKVYLKVAQQEDIRRIHVYKKIKAGPDNVAIWGSMTGPEPAMELDITQWVNPDSADFSGDPITGDVTFGIEGLCFRNTGTGVPAHQHFDGYIQFTLELRAGLTVSGADTVKLKVAPWLMLPHSLASDEVWARDDGVTNAAFRLNAAAEAGYKGLDDSEQLQTVPKDAETGTQWFQDHVEIGYTQRPGGPKTYVAFQLPYGPQMNLAGNPGWPRERLLDKDFGLFTLGQTLDIGYDSANYGGNLELLSPLADYPLGVVVLGDSGATTGMGASDRLKMFLNSQEKQVAQTSGVPVDWLDVSHIDEVISFLPDGSVAVVDPALAWSLLAAIPAAERWQKVFFATGVIPVGGVAPFDASADMRIETDTDHRNQEWHFIRITSGNEAGTVGLVSAIGVNFIRVSKVWRTGSKIINAVAPAWDIFRCSASGEECPVVTSGWMPQAGSRYVLCEGSRVWVSGVPAVVTVGEMLADADFQTLNTALIPQKMNLVKSRLQTVPGPLMFKSIPALFFGKLEDGSVKLHSCIAFNPGAVNLQPLNGKLYVPRQFGPLNASGFDMFENQIRTVLGTAVEFVDCWDLYHVWMGEVHCGSISKRVIFNLNWWEN